MDKIYHLRQTIILVFIMFSGILSAQTYTPPQNQNSILNEGCFTEGGVLPQLPVWTFTPSCSSVPEIIVTIGSTGQYAAIQLTAGVEYTFKSSVDTDFITISDENATTALATGVGTAVYTSSSNQLVRFYLHLDSDCNMSDSFDRTKTIQCGENPPIPANDTPQTAAVINCGESSTGNTVNGSDSGFDPSADVFYKFTGNGQPELITVSLCESGFDTYLRIFSDEALTNEVISNNDDESSTCIGMNFQFSTRSYAKFISDGTTTYYIMIEGNSSGYNSEGIYKINLTCEEIPEEPADCEDQVVLANNIQDGSILGGELNDRLAVDILVGEQGFTVYGVEPNFLKVAGDPDPTTFTIIFHEDESGLPGVQYASSVGTFISKEFVFNVAHLESEKYTIKLENPIVLTPNKVYWMEIQADVFAWESTYTSQIGQKGVLYNDNFPSWTTHPLAEFVYNLVCDEFLSVNDLNTYAFSYYPNPVKDELNFKASQEVRFVEIFNMAGQKINQMKLNTTDGKISTSNLSSGVYVFRAVLDGGQIETFKIVKK